MFRVLQCLFLIVLFAKSEAQVPGVGDCPDVEVVNDFDAGKYTGLWYEHERYPTIFEANAKCVTATYTAMPDGSIGVFNENIDSKSGAYKSINGSATFDGETNVAKLLVDFPSTQGPQGKYWVLGTDYESYSVVWSCTRAIGGNLNISFSWVLTREANPSQETLNKAYAVIEKNKVPKKHYMLTEQKDCNRKH